MAQACRIINFELFILFGTVMFRRNESSSKGLRITDCLSRNDVVGFSTTAGKSQRSASGGLQDSRSGPFFTVRYGSTLPGRRLSAGLRQRSSSAALCQLKDLSLIHI